MIYSAADLSSRVTAGSAASKRSVRSIGRRSVRTILRRAGLDVSRHGVVESLESRLAFQRELHRRTIRELLGWVSEVEPSWPPPVRERGDLFVDLLGTGTSEALYLVANLHACLGLDGAVAEFGVAQGATSAVIARELLDENKQLWLFDSFRGLPRPTPEDRLIDDIFELGSMDAYEGAMAVAPEEVVTRLARVGFPLKRATIVEGFLESTLASDELPHSFCFAYVDLDLYQPIKAVLTFLTERLVPGGVVVIDDYGHFSEGAQTAVDEFVRAHGSEFFLDLPRPWAGHFAMLTRLQPNEGSPTQPAS